MLAQVLVPYERVFSVPGMTVHGDGGDAVELFLQRAAAADGPAGTIDRHRAAEICRSLDGMALAIELAAARLPALGLDGLEAGLDDRLRLLAGGRRLDDRHRSLRSALDWSYALLTEAERAILRRVSVFATPFTTDAAAALLAGWPPAEAAGAAAGLAGLADHSLLAAVVGPDGARYRLLETIRQYGAERLGDPLADLRLIGPGQRNARYHRRGRRPPIANLELRVSRIAAALIAFLSSRLEPGREIGLQHQLW